MCFDLQVRLRELTTTVSSPAPQQPFKTASKLSVYVKNLNKCDLQPSIMIHESAVWFLRVNDFRAERQGWL